MILSILENGKIVKTDVAFPHFDYRCDVLVVGAGSAGVYAADSAAREGASVILCELAENIGGMHVCGNVTGYYYGAQGGSYVEDDMRKAKDDVFVADSAQWELRQIHLVERLQKSGVKILCRHSALGLYIEDGRVCGIRAFNGEKCVDIQAGITVDSTSDGHLIRMTETKLRYGRPTDNAFVPFGIFSKYFENDYIYSFNNDSGVMNHYDAADFSQKTIAAHALVGERLKDKTFVNLPLQTGIREGLTFEGEESLDYKKLLLGILPQKILFWAYSDLDRHGGEQATEEEFFQNWWTVANLATVTISIPVPLGAVVPKGIKGLLTAGRCLSCDTYTQSAVRMNRDMFRMGECIGIVAAMSALNAVDALKIDYEDFLRRARKRGCFDGYSHRRFSFDNSYQNYLNKMRALGRTPDKKYEHLTPYEFICEPIEFDVKKSFHLLQTDAPGVAIWSCFVAKDKKSVAQRLYDAMQNAKQSLYRYNCAIALGLLEDPRALPVLREIVQSRDCFFFTDNRRSNQFRSATAVCLLGRLGTKKDLPLLFEILDENELKKPLYHTLEANYLYHTQPDRNFVYFAISTHTCMALYKIYKRLGLDMNELHERFQQLFQDGAFLRRITNAKQGEHAYEETQAFINRLLKLTKK